MTHPQPYRPPLLQPPAALIRVDTCDTRSHTFRETHTASAQHLRGRRWLHTPTTAHCSLFTAHWTYTFSAKERDPETDLSYFGSRYYSSDLGIWLSVDPMSAKFPHESPYVYCGDNPLVFYDPDGNEKLIWVNRSTNKLIASGAEKYQDDGAIHIFSHGSSRGLTVDINGEKQTVRTAKQLDKLLSEHSEVWKNRQKDDNTLIVLHACRTGEGDESFAQKVSKELGVTVIAPDQRVYFDNTGEVGTYKAKYVDQNNEYKLKNNGDIKSRARSEEKGNWRVFYNGQETNSFRGDWHPKQAPDFLDIIKYCNF